MDIHSKNWAIQSLGATPIEPLHVERQSIRAADFGTAKYPWGEIRRNYVLSMFFSGNSPNEPRPRLRTGSIGRSPGPPPGLVESRQKKSQMACKPGSVPGPEAGGWPFIWDACRQAPRATYPGGGAETRLPANRLPPLFGLAPGGVYHATAVTGGAVRSYRTLSPLPPGRSVRAVCFLWHFPWGRPRRALPGTVFPWSPDFPPPGVAKAHRKAAIRPSGNF